MHHSTSRKEGVGLKQSLLSSRAPRVLERPRKRRTILTEINVRRLRRVETHCGCRAASPAVADIDLSRKFLERYVSLNQTYAP